MGGVARTASSVALGLTVQSLEGRTDVLVDLPPGVAVRSLSRALAREVGYPSGEPQLAVARTGAVLPSESAVGDCDLRSGDLLHLRGGSGLSAVDDEVHIELKSRADDVTLRSDAPVRRAAPSARVEISWKDGSADLVAGHHLIGSRSDADVRLASAGSPEWGLELAIDATGTRIRRRDGASISLDGAVLTDAWVAIEGSCRIRTAGWELALVVRPPVKTAAPRRTEPHRRRRTISVGSGGTIEFNRPPRAPSSWRPREIRLPQPPADPRPVRLPLIGAAVPLIAGLAMFLILHDPMFLAFTAISPLMAASTYVMDRRSGRRQHGQDRDRFQAKLQEAGNALYEAVGVEQRERHLRAPQLAVAARWVTDLDDRLWERRRWDADFLAVPLGWGRLPAQTRAVAAHGEGEPDPRVQQLIAQYAEVEDVPYVASLATCSGIGFAGHRATCAAAVRALVLQTALLHSPADVAIAAAMARGSESGWEWMKWLPHATVAAERLGGAALGTGTSGHDVLSRLLDYQRLVLRDAEAAAARHPGSAAPALLVVVDEQLGADGAIIAELLANGPTTKTAIVWLGSAVRGLPGGLGLVVDGAADGTARITEMDTGAERAPIRLDGADFALGDRVARALAPVRDASAAAGTAAIPSRVRLLDQLGLDRPTPARLIDNWQRPATTLGAVIGQQATEPMNIDLRADGPHALIAGTTGSGKSEMLRTLVASLAATHSPARLNFLLVDYKGGAAFSPCLGLPHVLDVVSDLDAELGERALVSLDAEMKRREHLLADARADNLIDLERRAPDLAPPNLVIMVDEFAKLRDEIPDFIDGVVDVAQRGRTLGIHMVLAAQSLRSAFTPAVRANTNLRLALRVTSETESQDVIDAVDAARIPSGFAARGRAFARIGHERLIEFQTSHVSGRYVDPTASEAEVRAFRFDTVLAPSARRRTEDDVATSSDETDLAALARAAREAAEELALAEPRPAWAPPLPAQLPRSVIQRHTNALEGRCALGLVDEPERQRQVPLVVTLDDGHLAIIGVGGSGKTMALQTLATTLAADAPPHRVQVYGIEGGAGGLSIIETLPHCGGVLPVSDAERIERLFVRLEGEAARRSALLGSVAATTLSEYQERRPEDPLPRIMLLLDDFAEFANMYDDARPQSIFERFSKVLAAGRAVGIHVALTANRAGVVRSNIAVHISQRVHLRAASADEYMALGIPARLAHSIELAPGRGFDSRAKLVQLALPQPSLDADPVRGYQLLGEHLGSVWPDERAPRVERLPDSVPLRRLSGSAPSLDALPVALRSSDLETCGLNLDERHALVVGPYRSGRSNALAVIASQAMCAGTLDEMHLLAPRRSGLVDQPGWRTQARGLDACLEAAEALSGRLDDLEEQPGARILIVIDDAGEIQDARAALALERLVRLGRDRGVRVAAAAESSAARMLSNVWIREVRKDGQGILLMADSVAEGDILGVSLPRRNVVSMVPGRGFVAARGTAVLAQLPLVEAGVQARPVALG